MSKKNETLLAGIRGTFTEVRNGIIKNITLTGVVCSPIKPILVLDESTPVKGNKYKVKITKSKTGGYIPETTEYETKADRVKYSQNNNDMRKCILTSGYKGRVKSWQK